MSSAGLCPVAWKVPPAGHCGAVPFDDLVDLGVRKVPAPVVLAARAENCTPVRRTRKPTSSSSATDRSWRRPRRGAAALRRCLRPAPETRPFLPAGPPGRPACLRSAWPGRGTARPTSLLHGWTSRSASPARGTGPSAYALGPLTNATPACLRRRGRTPTRPQRPRVANQVQGTGGHFVREQLGRPAQGRPNPASGRPNSNTRAAPGVPDRIKDLRSPSFARWPKCPAWSVYTATADRGARGTR